VNDLTLLGDSPFDAIRREDERGEYWSARDLMLLLGYDKWERFEDAIERAKVAMANAGQRADEQASRLREPVATRGKAPDTTRVNYRLTRNACYLVAMNGDPRKPEIASAQTYFAIKTREAETATPKPPSREDLVASITRRELAAWLVESEDAREALSAELAVVRPAAQSWTALADAAGDYAVADVAKILSRDPAITIGRDRLFEFLKGQGWIYRGEGGRWRPYQRAVECDRLSERMQSSLDADGSRVHRTPQVRVTTKGIHELHRLLGGSGPLLLSA
jgi:DNA-damage-inducible protein D